MKRKTVQIILIMLGLFLSGRFLNTGTAQSYNIKKYFTIKGSDSVKLKVEVEYANSRRGTSKNGCDANFIVTNIGTVPYTGGGSEAGENILVFRFTTNDGKTLEVPEKFAVDLMPGKTSNPQTVQAVVGSNKFCVLVQAIRLSKAR
jgi:hypothetical protein